MSEQKHTPGPWSIYRMDRPSEDPLESEGFWVHAAGKPVIWYTNDDDGLHATDADARLIAAAPDLLLSTRELSILVENMQDEVRDYIRPDGIDAERLITRLIWWLDGRRLRRAQENARIAIQKAEGTT